MPLRHIMNENINSEASVKFLRSVIDDKLIFDNHIPSFVGRHVINLKPSVGCKGAWKF